MDLALDTPEFHTLTLEPRVERGRHSSRGALEPLVGPVSIGGPVTVPLTKDAAKDDPELQAFLEGEKSHRYDLVHLAATFAPVDEPLQRVWIAVQLTRPDGGPEPLPVAWSMKPIQLSDEVTMANKATVGADAKLLSAGVELGSSRVSKDVSLQALYLMQSTPTWVLEETKSAQISGVQRFVLVVRSPKDAPARGRVDVGAIVTRKRFGPLTHKMPLTDVPEPLEFAVAG
jgi:hypothetical protein